jgi:hypothetical protein
MKGPASKNETKYVGGKTFKTRVPGFFDDKKIMQGSEEQHHDSIDEDKRSTLKESVMKLILHIATKNAVFFFQAQFRHSSSGTEILQWHVPA